MTLKLTEMSFVKSRPSVPHRANFWHLLIVSDSDGIMAVQKMSVDVEVMFVCYIHLLITLLYITFENYL